MKNNKRVWGFTLIELLVSITIIGIIATVSVATYGGYQERAKTAKSEAECAQIDHCEKTKTICVEEGDTELECDKLCDVTGLSCSGGGGVSVKADIIDSNFQSCLASVIGKNWIDVIQDDLTDLEVLGCQDEHIDSVAGIGNFINLRVLNLQGNNLVSLPDSIGNLTSLTTLNLYTNNLITLPNSFGSLASLNSFSLSGATLTSLPDSFGNLSSLRDIRIIFTSLTSLPNSFSNLTGLTYLTLKGNKLTALPAGMGNLTSLPFLNIQNNNIASMPHVSGTNNVPLHMSGNIATCTEATTAGWTGTCFD